MPRLDPPLQSVFDTVLQRVDLRAHRRTSGRDHPRRPRAVRHRGRGVRLPRELRGRCEHLQLHPGGRRDACPGRDL